MCPQDRIFSNLSQNDDLKYENRLVMFWQRYGQGQPPSSPPPIHLRTSSVEKRVATLCFIQRMQSSRVEKRKIYEYIRLGRGEVGAIAALYYTYYEMVWDITEACRIYGTQCDGEKVRESKILSFSV